MIPNNQVTPDKVSVSVRIDSRTGEPWKARSWVALAVGVVWAVSLVPVLLDQGLPASVGTVNRALLGFTSLLVIAAFAVWVLLEYREKKAVGSADPIADEE